ncbi:MAG: hypothetical protein PHN69_06020 [Candidatus Pacebacteria bacterium]|nr:hypothetical protein [Candidatus Paceibacterota bacterium]
MASKIMLIDKNNVKYLFCCDGRVYINDALKGLGKLVSPIDEIKLRKAANFILEKKKLKTAPLKGCMVND